MNRPIGPHDAPPGTKPASLRPDLAALQTEVGTSAPAGAVAGVQPVKNDVRLPSQVLLEARLPDAAPAPAPGRPHADAPPSLDTRWSAAARVIAAVLADVHAEAEPVRGATPLWPSPQKAPSGPVLASALDQTLSGSGMFYESHLREFSMGLRTLAQIVQEPQMRLTQPQPQAQMQALPQLQVQPHAQTPSQPQPQASPQPQPQVQPQSPSPTHHAAQAAPPLADAAAPNRGPSALRDAVDGAAAATAHAARTGIAEVVHPQTATLLHQQLDLLATATFRWSGQAWPDVPMTWTVQPEDDQPAGDARPRSDAEDDATAQRRWTTTVSLGLPKLGTVELRLSLAGEAVEARLAAQEGTTLARLRDGGGELAPRLAAAGLQLQALQFAPLQEAAPAAPSGEVHA